MKKIGVLTLFILCLSIFVLADVGKIGINEDSADIINYRIDEPIYYQDKGVIYTEYEGLKCNITSSLSTSKIQLDKKAHGFEFSYILDMPDVSLTPNNKFEPEITIICDGEITEENNVFSYGNFIIDFTTLEKEVNMTNFGAELKPTQNDVIAFDVSHTRLSDNSYKITPTLKKGYDFSTEDKIILDPSITIEDFDDPNIDTNNVTIEGNFSHLSIDTSSTPYESLVGYWNFDGDTENTATTTHYDFTLQNNDGIGVNNAVINETNCIYGNCLQLDGVDDYISILNFGYDDGDFTASLWINLKVIVGGSAGATIPLNKHVGSEGFYFKQNWGEMYVYILNSTGSSNTLQKTISGSENIWRHYVITKEGDNFTLYVDDSVAQTKILENYANFTGGVTIGDDVDGLIDEVMVFNSSLNSSQVSDIYNNQSVRYYTNGTQLNMTFDMSLDSDWMHFNFPDYETKLGSSIEYSVGEWDGTQYVYGSYQKLDIPYYQISNTSNTNWSLGFRFNAGTNNFYSPYIKTSTANSITGTSNTSITNCSYLLTDNTTYYQINDIFNDQLTDNCIVILGENITYDGSSLAIISDDDYAGVYSNQKNTTIKDCFPDMGSGGFGIDMDVGADNSHISGGIFGGIDGQLTAIQIGADNLHISDIECSGYNTNCIGHEAGETADSVTVFSSTICSSTTGIILEGNTHNLTDNTCTCSIDDPIKITGNSNVLENNDISSSNDETIEIIGDSNIIRSNTLQATGGGASTDGILITGDSNILIRNTIQDAMDDGIQITGDYNNLTGNTVVSCGDNGIEISGSGNNVTSGNYTGTTQDVSLGTSSTNNIFLNTTYDSDEEEVGAGSDLTRKWFYRAYINDSNTGDIIEGTNITAYNTTGDFSFNLSSDSTGYTDIYEIIDYVNSAGTQSHYSNYTVYAKTDSYNLHTFSYNVTLNENNYANNLQLDNTPPVITINYPDGTDQKANPLNINVLLDEIGLCKYSYDSGATINMSTGDNLSFIDSFDTSDGSHTLIFYCNDSVNNNASSSISWNTHISTGTGGGTIGGAIKSKIKEINISTDEVWNFDTKNIARIYISDKWGYPLEVYQIEVNLLENVTYDSHLRRKGVGEYEVDFEIPEQEISEVTISVGILEGMQEIEKNKKVQMEKKEVLLNWFELSKERINEIDEFLAENKPLVIMSCIILISLIAIIILLLYLAKKIN